MERKKYPIRAEEYELYEMVGQGASAVVQRALCVPLNEIVAIKILDFERHGSDLSNISREAQTMILIDHPNVLNAHCSFVKDHTLWVVMPYMAGGSCLHIMKSAFPDGFEESIIATILKEALKGLDYLHHHGHIHRDVKAGNILVDVKGGIKLGDFGVSACLFDSGDRQRSRNTFVGTPCWMAPEVMEQLHGYDFKADIWSFGITALELAHGHAPFSKYPPMKVLLMTLQNAPPGLDYESDKKFSRNFKHMIASCLVKDPSKRPTAHKLLKHTFFKQARSQDYFARKILEGLAALGDRYQALKEKEERLLAQKKMPDGKKEEISQNEYKRGISGWNFDIEDLKAQASLITCNEDAGKDQGVSNSFFECDNLQDRMSDRPYSRNCSFKEHTDIQSDGLQDKSCTVLPPDETSCSQRNRSDGSDNELKNMGASDQQVVMQLQKTEMDNPSKNCEKGLNGRSVFSEGEKRVSIASEIDEKNVNVSPTCSSEEPRTFTICPIDVPSLSRGASLKQQNQQQNNMNSNGEVSQTANESLAEIVPKGSKPMAPNGDDIDDKSKPPVVQQKGRFKVTSESIDFDKPSSIGLQKSHSIQVISQLQPQSLSPLADSSPSYANSFFQQLQLILQSNIVQRDHILSIMKQISTGDPSANRSVDGASLPSPTTTPEKSLLEAAHEREKELLQEVSELHMRLACSQEEVQRLKARNGQL
ncbi:serine/threonine-protein kinase BLUS1 [Dendrobium catenatum]|uniref:Mitogen-activated protein kinase kinase kinase ANP1 n=1 Tax=Dendrobium catenatum TaxID=906689 RepID=A0A2I0VH60_9ASPA|nr:serine/threonine-protein kinase BLUS1 [Dendrobium catenatum]PKU62704.1 Mitogen-activated protein kinase kinase kinase ANP1 [Dendrobium catenatum]